MTDLFKEIWDLNSSGKPFALATIVKTAGSSPREAGAKMLIFPGGSISGTIGGGKFEKMVIDDCLDLFRSGKLNLLKKYRFTQEGPDSTGMCCGGEAQVFMELHGASARLFIFGGGHIGLALSKLAVEVGFLVTVIDDRQEILDHYPASVVTFKTGSDYRENFPSLDANSYVAIITRGHDCDKSVLEQALRFDCAYIGMIGSRTKVSNIYSALKDKGFNEEKLSSVRAPIGLDIGAEGPQEIAMSIAAELIAVRRATGASSS